MKSYLPIFLLLILLPSGIEASEPIDLYCNGYGSAGNIGEKEMGFSGNDNISIHISGDRSQARVRAKWIKSDTFTLTQTEDKYAATKKSGDTPGSRQFSLNRHDLDVSYSTTNNNVWFRFAGNCKLDGPVI